MLESDLPGPDNLPAGVRRLDRHTASMVWWRSCNEMQRHIFIMHGAA